MGEHVRGERARLGEGIAALFALEGLLPGVDAHVHLKTGRCPEGATALFAIEIDVLERRPLVKIVHFPRAWKTISLDITVSSVPPSFKLILVNLLAIY